MRDTLEAYLSLLATGGGDVALPIGENGDTFSPEGMTIIEDNLGFVGYAIFNTENAKSPRREKRVCRWACCVIKTKFERAVGFCL